VLDPQICRSYDSDAQPGEGADGDVIALQLTVGARVIGVVELLAPDPDELEEALALVETVAGHAATAVEAARLYEQAQTLSLSDPLTGLANRRQLDDDLRLEADRALRYGRRLALLMIDLDHFKALNDRYGHPAGDTVLQQVAAVLTDAVRGCDSVYRYGGEELAVLARDTDLAGAAALAERLRNAVESHFAGETGGPAVTLSAGAAAVPDHAASPTTLIAAADHALYAAKAGGRNRVAVAALAG
jgi:diguanylate cyclase (GGDEF)-like protein